MLFYNFNQTDFKRKRDRVYIKSITGENSQLCLIRLEPGEITEHAHHQEQIGLVLSGQIEIAVGKEIRTLDAGEGYCIPGNLHHRFQVIGTVAAEYIEIFTPPKPENCTE